MSIRTFKRARTLSRNRARVAALEDLGLEHKFYDTSLGPTALTAPTAATGGEHDQSATIGPTTIPQGDGEQDRDGRKCVITDVSVTGVINTLKKISETSADNGNVVYICLVCDKQTNGALLSSENVFKNTQGSSTLAATPQRNLLHLSRYVILDSVELEILPPPIAQVASSKITQGGVTKPFKLNWRGKMPILFSGATESIVNNTDNSVHIIAFCSSASTDSTIAYNCRTRFFG